MRRGPRLLAWAVASPWPFVAVLVGLVLLQVLPLEQVVGGGPVSQLRRNSETAVMVQIPLYWLLFAGRRDLRGVGARPSPPRLAAQYAWIGGWLVLAVLLQGAALAGWLPGLDPRIVTLGEGALVVGLLSAWLGGTRGLLAPSDDDDQAGVRPAGVVRAAVAGAIVAFTLWCDAPGAVDVVGQGVVDLVRLNVEAVAGVLLLGISTDVVLVRRSSALAWRVAWVAVLVAVPVLVQVVPVLFPAGLADWINRGTEAFLAAILVTGWFHLRDVVRSRPG